MFFPTVKETPQTEVMTSVFGGYNHNLRIGEGQSNVKPVSALEFYDEENLTSDFYPMMANRAKRGIVDEAYYSTEGDFCGAYMLNHKLYAIYGDKLILNPGREGIKLMDDLSGNRNSFFASLGAYLFIFPEGAYINTDDTSDKGFLNETFSVSQAQGLTSLTYRMCKQDGTLYTDVATTQPANPTDGQVWLDTTENTTVLKVYSTSTYTWATIPTVYTRIDFQYGAQASALNLTEKFKQFDGVKININAVGTMKQRLSNLQGSKILQSVSGSTDNSSPNYIVVIGLIDSSEIVQTVGGITISRDIPEMDYVVEANNRLWGCYYGENNGKMLNEIYACALGDPKNWSKFQGISTDSYTASIGKAGKWTGAITYKGYPMFFKEDAVFKVYTSSTGAHQIKSEDVLGVKSYCGKTLKEVDNVLYYYSRRGVCAYDGSRPLIISDRFKDKVYQTAVGGVLGAKYYLAAEDEAGNIDILVYDTKAGIWHKENADTLKSSFRDGRKYMPDMISNKEFELGSVEGMCGDGVALYLNTSANIWIIDESKCDTAGYKPMYWRENNVPWSATTGLIGYTAPNHKYISRMKIRMVLPKESWMKISIEYDSDGVWHSCGKISGVGTKSFVLPVRPRRCDHFRLKLEGEGDFRIYSITKVHEQGSDVE